MFTFEFLISFQNYSFFEDGSRHIINGRDNKGYIDAMTISFHKLSKFVEVIPR